MEEAAGMRKLEGGRWEEGGWEEATRGRKLVEFQRRLPACQAAVLPGGGRAAWARPGLPRPLLEASDPTQSTLYMPHGGQPKHTRHHIHDLRRRAFCTVRLTIDDDE